MTNRGYGTALSEKLNLGFKNWVQIIHIQTNQELS